MSDERSYETMASEHAEWLCKALAHAVKATLETLYQEKMLTADVPRAIKDAIYRSTRSSFLRGAYGFILSSHTSRKMTDEELISLAKTQASRADQESWEWLMGSWSSSKRMFMSESHANWLISQLVDRNCAEMFFHGRDHARRQEGEKPNGEKL